MASAHLGNRKRAAHLSLLVLCLTPLLAQAQSNCQRQERCDACIQTQGCMWCPNPKTGKDGEIMEHCQPTTIDASSFCDLKELENPRNEHSITANEPLTSAFEELTSSDEKIIQLAPQGMKLKLRKATPETITVKFRQAQGYPVDLYYLMDLSNSMKDDKAKLAALGGELTNTLRNLTKKFTIGFGSFVDKVMMPFAETSPDKINTPCPNCTRAYAFKNNMPLDTDEKIFTQRVEEADISGNLDSPEGGFDALMQAMVCKEEIGWRQQSRRIIVYSTDDKFHYAGDGRLAGIVAPNDERCHLNEDSEYEAYDIYDYPSVAQVNKIAKRENINIIFAVSGFVELYADISRLIETSSYGLMNEDSSNVVELVVNQYSQISSKVRLTDNSTNSPVSIRYSSDCKNSTGDPQECSGISQGSEVTYKLEVTAKECPKDQDTVVVEVKTMQDSLFLEIEFDCSCNCEKVVKKDNSSVCTYHGYLVCGVCDCFPGYQGQQCMCSSEDASDGRPEDEQLCKAPDEDRVCSGQGYCRCGACACREEEITGRYCECNRRKCLTGYGMECSGHGSCECDHCECDHGYHGQFCECPPESECIKPGTVEVCSGHGTCECGRCKCNQTFSGQFCDDCLECKTGRCLEFRDCVQCLFNNPPCECNLTTIGVESLAPYIKKGAQECTFDDESDNCFFKFSYLYRDYDMGYDIHVLKNKECPEEAPVMRIVLGLVGGIVAAGLLALIAWKIATVIHDRKEYERFKKESMQGTWSNDNILYRDPLQTVQNPVFSKET